MECLATLGYETMGPCGDDSIYGDKALQNKIGDVWFGTFAAACLARLHKRKHASLAASTCACKFLKASRIGSPRRARRGSPVSQRKVTADDGISCIINKHKQVRTLPEVCAWTGVAKFSPYHMLCLDTN